MEWSDMMDFSFYFDYNWERMDELALKSYYLLLWKYGLGFMYIGDTYLGMYSCLGLWGELFWS